MNRLLILRVTVTLLLVVAAILLCHALWQRYEQAPWTRDGRVQADIVQIAPDVAGPIARVFVKDDQQVTVGTPLFEIDQKRFRLAVARAEAALAAQTTQAAQARRELARDRALGELVAAEQREQSLDKLERLESAVAEARVALDSARLDLQRSVVRSAVDGTVSNFDLRPGDYAVAGHAVLAIVDKASLRITAYFEETKLPRVHVGDPVRARLMGEQGYILGHVTSIASGIEDRERRAGANMLADVNPTFTWVRLAQRIPVRVAIDRVPRGLALIAGRTATVEVMPRADQPSVAGAAQ
ncbi:HlyD family secretion protein [uncultured Sphingomonas sp.]|uniref:efflux RND transporter periplasmic adaptor subunit n=1 Tax=uncultured Sphingomonas sp. TaxID=158754 RepID=UPI00260E07F5|nr:HlyD family secretion protein [uncultured Sphingomonas sp.]